MFSIILNVDINCKVLLITPNVGINYNVLVIILTMLYHYAVITMLFSQCCSHSVDLTVLLLQYYHNVVKLMIY